MENGEDQEEEDDDEEEQESLGGKNRGTKAPTIRSWAIRYKTGGDAEERRKREKEGGRRGRLM